MKRVLLDENAPKRLGRLLRSDDLDVRPFPNHWKGLTNGRLLGRMEADGFSVLMTCDQNIPAQQNLAAQGVGLVVLATNDVLVLADHLDAIRSLIRSVRTGEALRFDVPVHR